MARRVRRVAEQAFWDGVRADVTAVEGVLVAIGCACCLAVTNPCSRGPKHRAYRVQGNFPRTRKGVSAGAGRLQRGRRITWPRKRECGCGQRGAGRSCWRWCRRGARQQQAASRTPSGRAPCAPAWAGSSPAVPPAPRSCWPSCRWAVFQVKKEKYRAMKDLMDQVWRLLTVVLESACGSPPDMSHPGCNWGIVVLLPSWYYSGSCLPCGHDRASSRSACARSTTGCTSLLVVCQHYCTLYRSVSCTH